MFYKKIVFFLSSYGLTDDCRQIKYHSIRCKFIIHKSQNIQQLKPEHFF